MMRAIVGSTVLYPSDAVGTEKLVEQMAQTKGICFLRTSRPKTPVIYSNDEAFPDRRREGAAPERRRQGHGRRRGRHACLRRSRPPTRSKAEGIGITVIDAYSIKPLGKDVILAAAQKTNNTVITVEDHYAEGGLGDAVAGELSVRRHQGSQAGRERPAALRQAGGIAGAFRH